jgi:hypothetical protein
MTRRDRLRAELVEVLPAWVAARAVVALAAWLASALAARDRPGGTTLALSQGLVAWDGQWYEGIARFGYGGLAERVGSDEGLRFFPLHPLLARIVEVLPGIGVAAALVLVANVAALAVAVLARRTTLAEGHGPEAARRAVWLLSLFPPAFVLVWGYAEALFLIGAMGGLLACRRRWWWLAAGAGLVAGATRPLGLLLVAPFAWEAWEAWRGRPGLGAPGRPPVPAVVAAVAAPAVGTAAYLAWVGRRFGDPLLPFTVQSPLRGEAVDPLTRLGRGLADLVGPERFGDGLHLPFALALALLAVLTFRHWPRSYGILGALFLVTALSAENLNSLERYGLNAFPLVLTLAVVGRSWWAERIALAVCAGGLLSLASLAWLGVYVP